MNDGENDSNIISLRSGEGGDQRQSGIYWNLSRKNMILLLAIFTVIERKVELLSTLCAWMNMF